MAKFIEQDIFEIVNVSMSVGAKSIGGKAAENNETDMMLIYYLFHRIVIAGGLSDAKDFNRLKGLVIISPHRQNYSGGDMPGRLAEAILIYQRRRRLTTDGRIDPAQGLFNSTPLHHKPYSINRLQGDYEMFFVPKSGQFIPGLLSNINPSFAPLKMVMSLDTEMPSRLKEQLFS